MKYLLLSIAFFSLVQVYGQRTNSQESNKTCRITARLGNAFFQDLKARACKVFESTCSEIIAVAQEEFQVNIRWNGVRKGIYDRCNWILKGREVTLIVPKNKVAKILADLKKNRYFSSVSQQ